MSGPRAPIEPTVFLLSSAVLAFEILLLRLFAIEYFHHFAYMAIGMAMLGFGASGTALVLARNALRGREQAWFESAAALFALSLVFAVPLAHLVTFDPTQILWDPAQWRALGVVYVALALPFLIGGGALALALMAAGDRVGRVYAANLLGSAAGALVAVLLLAWLRPERAIAATAILAAAGAGFTLLRRPARLRIAGATGLLLIAILTTIRPPWSPRITPFKGLPQVAAFAGATPAGERWGPVGWVAAIRAPAFRHAPGLSLGFTGTLPPQTALFVDGATVGAATDWRGDAAALDFLRWLPSAGAHAAIPADRVLVLGAGDGLEVLAALGQGARHVTAVELNSPLTTLADAVLPPASRIYSDPRVRLIAGDARTFSARSRDLYDIVVLPIAGGFGGSSGSIHGLGEDYLNTIEAYAAYLRRLAPGGVLAITRWIDAPPRDNVKVLLTAAAALRRENVTDVGAAIVFLRSWAAATTLVRPDGFGAGEIQRIAAFASERLFDVDWPLELPAGPHSGDVTAAGTQPDPEAGVLLQSGPIHNLLARPVFTEAARAGAGGAAQAAAYARDYPFDVAPPTDDRPYFGRFLRLGSMRTLLATQRGSWLPFVEWGYLTLLVTLAQSAVIAALLTLVPALLLVRRRRGVGSATRVTDGLAPTHMLRVGLYFGAIGAAYLLIEIAMIQKLTLVLGHPVYAAAAVLAAFLALSGMGSLLSDRLRPGAAPRAACVAAAAALVLALGLGFDAAGRIQPLPFPGRLALSLLILTPLATSMGMPFPLGLRRLARAHGAVAWGWAVNGFASVIAASLAALIAFETGTRALLVVGAGLYLVAAMAARARLLDDPRHA